MAQNMTRLAGHRRLAARLRARRAPVFWIGAVLAIAGLAVLASPTIAPMLVGVAAGWLLWLAGAALLAFSLLLGERGLRFGGVLAGLLTVASGAFIFFNPMAGALAATVLVAAVLIVEGAFELTVALHLRPLAAWRWVLASALATCVAAVIIASGAAAWSTPTLALILGVAFGSSGLALMALGLSGRRTRGRPSVGAFARPSPLSKAVPRPRAGRSHMAASPVQAVLGEG